MTERAWRSARVALSTFQIEEAPVSDPRQQDVMDDAARLRAWLDDVGGAIFLGGGRLKTAKISKKGNKLTLVIKKKNKSGDPDSSPD